MAVPTVKKTCGEIAHLSGRAMSRRRQASFRRSAATTAIAGGEGRLWRRLGRRILLPWGPADGRRRAALVPLAILHVIMQCFTVQGMTAGSVKG
jgi:hypothetical protein